MKLKFSIKAKNLPAFAGFLSGSAIKGIVEIVIDPENNILAAAEHDINFYDLLAENTVHEMIHAFQELYRQSFSEEQVENAIEQAKKYLESSK